MRDPWYTLCLLLVMGLTFVASFIVAIPIGYGMCATGMSVKSRLLDPTIAQACLAGSEWVRQHCSSPSSSSGSLRCVPMTKERDRTPMWFHADERDGDGEA